MLGTVALPLLGASSTGAWGEYRFVHTGQPSVTAIPLHTHRVGPSVAVRLD